MAGQSLTAGLAVQAPARAVRRVGTLVSAQAVATKVPGAGTREQAARVDPVSGVPCIRLVPRQLVDRAAQVARLARGLALQDQAAGPGLVRLGLGLVRGLAALRVPVG